MDASEVSEVRLSPDAKQIAYTVRTSLPNEVWAFR
jgi:hypothetical protein